ncbi:MAG: anhydro-N-acetylmuramic acid kinase [Rhodospirillales bacterium]|nr:anhydro-N-acetylmuramic acid kinase [Rhodospirillales bacterium]MBT4038489.1 anhydro-N-acetylmuramic acid kinase [Rhodospirillales bacterium]MBT4625656.1 anhydro-N-acetylmuramic acid kinase [Rhodospirillales bacterium]MBT5351838.1 anhydro-N-acetylmuramic acid kinase [Rhodospirillales bacterium]MBT5519200.1 anhydro-N-acetylmuramic acid kinase [Rhodospirillales bacterium]
MRRAIGLMSGTSMDGVDAALVETDGVHVQPLGATAFVPIDQGFRDAFRALERPDPENASHYDHLVGELTAVHADAVDAVLMAAELDRSQIDVIGFHGQTVYHAPKDGVTIQLGDGQDLANRYRVPVVADFRSNDVQAGGEGAPLAPLYHRALARDLNKPLAVLNIGGVANVTWLGSGDVGGDDDILAFDTGPGNAMMDDWVRAHTGAAFDEGGALAQTSHVDQQALSTLLDHPYFDTLPPKSLDRRGFDASPVSGLSLEAGASTLSAFSVAAIVRSQQHMPERPERWLICGGGRHNSTLMQGLRDALGVPVDSVETVGWDGDYLEAQAFAYLAVRAMDGLPLSLPTTTGVSTPLTGGQVFNPC